jgi:diguanylate cyclase (GGDEF)-like protein/PAS domain S-box-containing protein
MAAGVPPTPLHRRVIARILDPSLGFVIVLVPVFWVARAFGLIADVPLWLLFGSLVGAWIVSAVAAALWADSATGWRVWARVGAQVAGTAFVIYAIGWGATLAIGLVFCAVDSIRINGVHAARPAIVWSILALAAGELAIALGVAPTLVPGRHVHGLALLGALGVTFTIIVFYRSAQETERAERQVRESEVRFRALLEHASDIVMVLDSAAVIEYVSPPFERILDYSAADVIGTSGVDLAHEEDVDALRASLAQSDSDEADRRHEIRLRHHDGSWRWFDLALTDRSDDPIVRGWVANLRDITDRKSSEAALAEAQAAFRHAFDDAPIGIGLVDVEGRILRVNRSFARMLQRTREELLGMSVVDLTHPDDRASSQAERDRLVRGDSESYRVEKRYLRADGSVIWVSLNVSMVRDADQQPLYMIGQVEDITDRKATGDRLAYEARHDSMTGLTNRATFTDLVSRALEDGKHVGRRVAVLFVDLDHFKLINDGLGHAVGDEVLTTVAQRLRSVLGPRDIVGRFGGDEFLILCDHLIGLTGARAAKDVARRVSAVLAEAIQLSEGEIFVTASIGVALSEIGDTGETLMRHADAAMYRAKHDGRARAAFFDPQMDQSAIAALRTSTDLHHAVERGELVLHYQPIFDIRRNEVAGVEALLRWNHPVRGLLAPPEFIHLAEENGVIVSIGEWVLQEACRQAALWNGTRRAAGSRALMMHVNLSPRQVADPTLLKKLVAILRETDLSPSLLCLEVTEHTLMGGSSNAAKVLRPICNLGVHLSVDDFGTGYSSLANLRETPVETLKIDRTFVAGLGQSADGRAIVAAIVTIAHSLGLTAVAEGVETEEQLALLNSIGCDFAQGYLLGRPGAADGFLDGLDRVLVQLSSH